MKTLRRREKYKSAEIIFGHVKNLEGMACDDGDAVLQTAESSTCGLLKEEASVLYSAYRYYRCVRKHAQACLMNADAEKCECSQQKDDLEIWDKIRTFGDFAGRLRINRNTPDTTAANTGMTNARCAELSDNAEAKLLLSETCVSIFSTMPNVFREGYADEVDFRVQLDATSSILQRGGLAEKIKSKHTKSYDGAYRVKLMPSPLTWGTDGATVLNTPNVELFGVSKHPAYHAVLGPKTYLFKYKNDNPHDRLFRVFVCAAPTTNAWKVLHDRDGRPLCEWTLANFQAGGLFMGFRLGPEKSQCCS